MGQGQYSSITIIKRLQEVKTSHPWLRELVARKLLEARARYVIETEEEVRRAYRLPNVQG
jgi:hypothetical protein